MLRQLFSRSPDDAIPEVEVMFVDAAARAGHLRLVDVRGPEEFAAGHPAGSINGPLEPIDWQIGDVLDWRPEREYGLWHDRAACHFLTDETDRQRYRDTVDTTVAPGGAITIETFAPDGPDGRSGLPATRSSRATLDHELGPGVAPVESGHYEHHTPSGASQAFI